MNEETSLPRQRPGLRCGGLSERSQGGFPTNTAPTATVPPGYTAVYGCSLYTDYVTADRCTTSLHMPCARGLRKVKITFST
eukprot:3074316-Prymnesium_polylepis.1